jgi:hypothetical protein
MFYSVEFKIVLRGDYRHTHTIPIQQTSSSFLLQGEVGGGIKIWYDNKYYSHPMLYETRTRVVKGSWGRSKVDSQESVETPFPWIVAGRH